MYLLTLFCQQIWNAHYLAHTLNMYLPENMVHVFGELLKNLLTTEAFYVTS